ncbi:MAG: magnesium transporter [Alphaproteobacteria bacterium]|nr:magnesium transporter [Alphaproteobacteria bacterium]
MNDSPGSGLPAGPEISTEAVDAARVIAPAFIARFVGAVGDGDIHFLRRTINDLHPADAADLLEHLPPDAFRKAIHLLDARLPAEAVAELSDEMREAALAQISDAGIASIIENLDSDDASFILNDLEDTRRTRILARVSATDRAAIESSLAFDEESAGRLMQRDFVAAPVFWTVGQAIDHLRTVEPDDLPDTFFEIYIVDPAFRLQGSVPVSTLLRSGREAPLKDLMKEAPVQITTQTDQEEVAYLFQQYNLASAPVVDEAGRLTGMITVDDMVDVIQEENREDLLALSGVNDAGGNQSVFSAVRARIPWLAINLATAFLASTVVSLFSGVIDRYVALAFLMPVVAGLGGNAGSQALAVSVRAIAERDLEGALVARAIRREAITAIINGIIIATLAAIVVYFWFGNLQLTGVILAAMCVTFTWAGLVGILAPLTLKRIGADPAVASSVFVLTSIDLMGFFVFLGLATLVLA